ncbi:FecCD family ABC transporter permease [Mycetocola reblochoni]|uniref:ABC-type Fe3+-siderophore transport system, permease 2 component n=2 Tax=Mycetocola reblochoni TaxID=331618 RepID=A0A1R4ICT4_9MICO|nr:iron ABC transporter permease [Mycetocola reblochoni]RLP69126.1 iron ABC transporter permease [Mycetocola reblochoni]SJN17526.1 ABC-type Fe3+-siderophore transport system, permease 2 component [Mycetocola reblochoni REB411]
MTARDAATHRPTQTRTRTRTRRPRRLIVAAALGAVGLGIALLSLSTGESTVPLSVVVDAVVGRDTAGAGYIVAEFRLPRVLGAVLVGVGLGAAGAVTQSLLRNPLASPDIIGVTSGASTAAVVALAATAGLASSPAGAVAGMPVALAALLGGLLAGALVLAGAWRRGLEPGRVVLVGLGVNAGFGALTSWVLLRAELPGLQTSLVWLTGSLNNARMTTILPVALIVLLALTLLALGSRTLGMLRYDARVAAALGVRVSAAQLVLLGLAVVLASAVTAVAGPVPFVAFVAPQIALALFRTEGPPLAYSALLGAVMMLASDLIAARAFAVPLPVGIVTAVLGVPVLLWILLRAGRRERGRGRRGRRRKRGQLERRGRGGRERSGRPEHGSGARR